MPGNSTAASVRDADQMVILAGGKGTRLRGVVGDLPKPMALIGGKPLLEHQVELAQRSGFRQVLFLTSYRSEIIEQHFGDGSRFGLEFIYAVDEIPLGTAGALLRQIDLLKERFLVLYGDVMLDVDLNRMVQWHVSRGAEATLLVHPNDHPHDSDLVETDLEDRVTAFHGYPHPEGSCFPNKVNAALYLLEKGALARWSAPERKHDIAKDLFPSMLEAGQKLYAYSSREYIKDMGTPERLAKVNRDWTSGKIEALAWRNAVPAIFLDRDGTINCEVQRLRSPDQMGLLDGVGQAIRAINHSTRLAVVVTNQPVIARGDCDEKELSSIHAKLETLLGQEGAYLDAIYYCPHHPDAGYPGERADLKIQCQCRKPGPGMFERATGDLHLDLARSWMVGDTTTDMEAARRLKLRSILVQTGHAGEDGKFAAVPDYIFRNLPEAIEFILQGHELIGRELEARLSEWSQIQAGQIFVLGGLARSGKSTVARVLHELLVERGHVVKIVNLDGFLKPVSERGPTVMERYDLPAIRSLALALRDRPSTGGFRQRLGAYVRKNREVVLDRQETEFLPDDIVVIEGVVGLKILDHLPTGAYAFYISVAEAIRKSRFLAEYRGRGYETALVEKLYSERQEDESRLIRADVSLASAIVEISNLGSTG